MQKRIFCGKEVSALGFGVMRLPLIKDTQKIDMATTEQMFDMAINGGITYFDTAYYYHDGQSERIVGEMLRGVNRASYSIATKLPLHIINSADDCKRYFEEQLGRLKADRIDFLLAHNVCADTFYKLKKFGAHKFLMDLKTSGVADNVGFSFHDTTPLFRRTINEFDWDFCQLQLNYVDWNLQEAKTHSHLANEKGLPIVVMEPVRGGLLANLPEECAGDVQKIGQGSQARPAFMYAAHSPGVKVVLSGMSNTQQLSENISTFSNLSPLTPEQTEVLYSAANKLISLNGITCTECRYCDKCPKQVAIPEAFLAYNNYILGKNKDRFHDFFGLIPKERRPSECISCGVCEQACPQHISIIEKLKQVTELAQTLGHI